MPDNSSPPERTEELVERVARALYRSVYGYDMGEDEGWLARGEAHHPPQENPYSEENMEAIRRQLDGRPDLRETRHRRVPAEPLMCNCQTCGVVNARIRGALAARGWEHAATHHVRIEGFDFRGGSDPYLAVVKVDGAEIQRAYEDLNELLDDAVLGRVEAALRRHLC